MMDCNVTRVFLKEWQRMCNAVGSCENCKLWKDRMPCVNNMGMFKNEPEKAIALVQEWSDSHPVKTRLSLLKEAFPNAPIYNGEPCMCVKMIYGSDIPCAVPKEIYKMKGDTCLKCWNTPIE